MTSFRLSAAAEADIHDILAWSQAEFGEAARRRYQRLILTGLKSIAEQPARLGSAERPELGPGVRTWHLHSSREEARDANGVVQRPGHFIIYRLNGPHLIVIGRILHDAMKLRRHMTGPDTWT